MPQAKLNIPVLVRQTSDESAAQRFEIRPLFYPYPQVGNSRYKDAEAEFKRQVRERFARYTFSEETAHVLMWYSFNPAPAYARLHLLINVQNNRIEGDFTYAFFHRHGNTYVVLPAFDDYIFIAENDGKNLSTQVERVISEYMRGRLEERDADFDPREYTAPKREFLRTIEMTLPIRNREFSAGEDDLSGLLGFGFQDNKFWGAEEILKTGYALNHSYPGGLRSAFHREKIVRRLEDLLFGKENVPIALVGKTGVGKHTVVEQALKNYLESGIFSDESKYDHVWHLKPGRVISGMKYVGQWERRFEAILEYLEKPLETENRRDKLLIDNAVALLRIGNSAGSNMNLAAVMKPRLEQRRLQVTLLATPAEWKILQEKDRSFADLFRVIPLDEPGYATTVKIVLRQRRVLEHRENTVFSLPAILQIFSLQRTFLKNKALPGAVLQLMEQAAKKYAHGRVDSDEIRADFVNFSGYRPEIFDENFTLEPDETKAFFGNRLVGQEAAVRALTDLISLIKAKLTNPRRPLGSFIFIGATGVGKTQAAKVLARFLTGDEKNLLRFDMNEYNHGGAVSQLIGNYYNPEGVLTGQVRHRPFSVLLLDEIEKADPGVADLLLQVLDDGRLTDSIGRTVDFTNTVIILTSNLGAAEVGARLGYTGSTVDDTDIYRQALRRRFRPEFINRIGKTVIFNPLAREHIYGIAKLQIGELLERDGFVRRSTILNIDPEALKYVAERGYDRAMGGRALKRQIEADLTELSAAQLVTRHSEQPIIFNIVLRDGKLSPDIQPLVFAEEIEEPILPALPPVDKFGGMYRKLEREIAAIERKAFTKAPPESRAPMTFGSDSSQLVNWKYYAFTDRVAELHGRVKDLILGYGDSRFRVDKVLPLRFKMNKYSYQNQTALRRDFADKMFQQEAVNELSEDYKIGNPQFDSIETEYLDNFLTVKYLRAGLGGLLRDEWDKIRLEFRALIEAKGKEETEFLAEKYAAFFEALGLVYRVAEDKKSIEAEGYALFDIMRGETGLHLFYKMQRNPIPVECRVRHLEKNRPLPKNPKVLRIYGRGVMNDLRTGYSTAESLTAGEMKALVYAGFLSRS